MENILFKNSKLIIKDYGDGILYQEIIGNVDLETVKILDEQMLLAIRQTKSAKIISNIAKMQLLANNAAEYNNDFLIPNWETNGVKYNAMIIPADTYGKLSIENLKNKYDTEKEEFVKKGFVVEIFNNKEDAIAWLTKQS